MTYIVVLLFAIGCAPYLPEDGGGCPCKDGWKCCNGRCIPEQNPCAGEDVILATGESGCITGGTPFSYEQVIPLAYNNGYPECYGEIGGDTPHSGPETTVYDASNEEGFGDVVNCMTNGLEDTVSDGCYHYPRGSGAGGLYKESEFWNKTPDLAGCTITKIRHVIHMLTVTPDDEGGCMIIGDWVWEVWGDCGGED